MLVRRGMSRPLVVAGLLCCCAGWEQIESAIGDHAGVLQMPYSYPIGQRHASPPHESGDCCVSGHRTFSHSGGIGRASTSIWGQCFCELQ